jgi:hypothetical protein
MMEDQTQTAEQNEVQEELPPPRYVISEEEAQRNGRALPVMIASRMNYMSQQTFDEEVTPESDIQPLIDRIAEFDSKEHDYLLPDTPLKEALFRILLANGNRPMTPQEISEILTDKWAMTAYPREMAPWVIERLLDSSQSYCIVQLTDE